MCSDRWALDNSLQTVPNEQTHINVHIRTCIGLTHKRDIQKNFQEVLYLYFILCYRKSTPHSKASLYQSVHWTSWVYHSLDVNLTFLPSKCQDTSSRLALLWFLVSLPLIPPIKISDAMWKCLSTFLTKCGKVDKNVFLTYRYQT